MAPKTQGATQMNREQELAKLAQLEKEVADLRALLEKPQRAPSLLSVPEPESEESYWELHANVATGDFYAVECAGVNGAYAYGNAFQSEALAQAYAEAIGTMLILRHQPGTVSANRTDQQWSIRTDGTTGELWVDSQIGDFTDLICPAFNSRKSVHAAIATVGEDRILRMFKVLHHADN